MKGRVFKFMSGESYHLDSLRANQVYFSRFDELNDPYEGLLFFSQEGVTDSLRMALLANGLSQQDELNISEGRKHAERLVRTKGKKAMRALVSDWTKAFFDDYLKYHLENRFVLSMSLQSENDEFPSPLTKMMMWSHYADGMRGLCVEYDYDLLLKSMESLNEGIQISTRPVTYSERNLPIVRATTVMKAHMKDDGTAGTEMIDAFCTKNDAWWYENELRFIGSQYQHVNFDERAISRVFVGEKNPTLLAQVKDILSAKSFHVPLYTVRVRDRTYGVGFSRQQY